jgi:hypothetical protein
MRNLQTQEHALVLLEEIRLSEPLLADWVVERGEWDAFGTREASYAQLRAPGEDRLVRLTPGRWECWVTAQIPGFLEFTIERGWWNERWRIRELVRELALGHVLGGRDRQFVLIRGRRYGPS